MFFLYFLLYRFIYFVFAPEIASKLIPPYRQSPIQKRRRKLRNATDEDRVVPSDYMAIDKWMLLRVRTRGFDAGSDWTTYQFRVGVSPKHLLNASGDSETGRRKYVLRYIYISITSAIFHRVNHHVSTFSTAG